MKRTIVICEYISTGMNYIEDVLARGYEPVLLEGHYVGTDEEVSFIREARDELNASFNGRYRIIKESADYEEILRQVKEVDPVLVIPGGEFGVPLATRLADDLHLPGTPVSRLRAMTEKDAMHEALRKKGLRYIRGKIIASEEEALEWYEELGCEDVVVKRTRGGGTEGVYLCHGKEEMINAVRKSFSAAAKGENGKDGIAILIQEQIKGIEYIVNTVSCNGKHRVVSAWEYDKLKMANGGNAYNHVYSIPRLEIGHSRLLRYALQVVEAIGIEYGPVHGEYMIDEKGPVLIEVNCRPIGGFLRRKFMERIFGHHETDVALDSYLDSRRIVEDSEKPYRLDEFGAIKFFILPKDTEVKSAPIIQIAMHLKSYFSSFYSGVGRTEFLPETRDMETDGGRVFLLNKDENIVKTDCEMLHMIEMKYPRILYQGSDYEEQFKTAPRDINAIIDKAHCEGTTLLFTDTVGENITGVSTVGTEELSDAYDSYEQGIIDLSNPETYSDLESVVQQIYELFRKVRKGGRIIVPESTYCHFPYGIEGMEIIMRTAGLRIELPLAQEPNLLVSTVE